MRIAGLFVLATSVALWTYAPAFGSYLVTDDFQWIDGGMQFTLARLIDIAGRDHFYRPAIEIYFALMQAVSGCSAQALHAASVTVHVINVGLVMRLAFATTGASLFAGLSGLIFACQPAPAEAVLWPSAVTTLLCTTFGLLMLLLDAGRERSSSARDAAIVAAFALALGCHESAVMFLPAAVLLRYAVFRYARGERDPSERWLRHYLPSAIVLVAYVALTAWINSRNYVVTEGHYTPGFHVVRNLLDYLVALYAGQRRTIEYALVAGGCVLLLWKGDRLLRAWTAWMLMALVPVLPFEWGTSSRYLYIPAIPFAFLVARGITWLIPLRKPIGIALATAATMLVVVRSATFARKGALAFESQAARYADAAALMRQHRTGDTITVPRSAVEWIPPLYLDPLARTAACDARVRVDAR